LPPQYTLGEVVRIGLEKTHYTTTKLTF